MELTSSKLRLASSVSSEETIFKSSSSCGNCDKRHVILLVVFLGLISVAAGGFLIGYFVVQGNNAKANRECAGGKENRTGNQNETEQLTVAEVFSKFEKEVSAEELRENLRIFSSEIHLAGLERSRQMAEMLAQEWRKYGFDEVEMPAYKVLLSYPMEDKPNMISLVDSNGTVVKNITEQLKVSPGPGVRNTSLFAPYTAYSMNGTAEGKLVYINQGTKRDFEELEKHNVSVNGSILIGRNGLSFYPTAFLAAKKGAKGMLMYLDPKVYAREGLGKNSTYPHTQWLDSDAVVLAGISHKLGDPLTDGLPSLDGIYRKSVRETMSFIPRILLQPISYGTARFLLKQAGEDSILPDWFKDLNATFKFDGTNRKGNQTIKLSIHNQLVQKTIYNVIGTITGREEPDRYVFMGNHRDAWVYGAADATTGISVLKETSRVLGRLVKEGWRPRRSIKLCSFGGEEFGLMGSVEWMDENSLIFKARGVAYLNTDVPVGGKYTLLAQTDPLLTDLIYKWTKQVQVPVDDEKYESMFDIMLKRGPAPAIPGEPFVPPFKFMSDYIPFYFMAGIPSADFSYFYNYSKSSGWELYPSYHTQLDTFYWIQKFADPKFEIHRAMTLLMGGMLIDIADSRIIPLNVSRLKNSLHQAYDDLITIQTAIMNTTLVQEGVSAVNRSLVEFSRQCDLFASVISEVRSSDNVHSLTLRMLNNQLNQLGKAFIHPRMKSIYSSVFQHVAHSGNFAGVKLTAKKKTNDTAEVEEQLSIVSLAISTAAKILKLIKIRSSE